MKSQNKLGWQNSRQPLRCALLYLAILAATPFSAHAENLNIIRTPAMIQLSDNDDSFWAQIDSYATDWTNIRSEYACSVWSPDPSTQTIGTAFLQTQSCSQDQERTVQQRQQNVKTEAIRNVGVAQTESRTLSPSHTRDAVGALETWVATSPTFSNWEAVSGAHDCSNWSPSPSSYTQSATFNQKATNCVVDQARTRQEREQETTTGAIRDSGSPVPESRQINSQTASRPYVIAIGDWANQGDKQSCSNWAPATTTVGLGKAFTQTATDCQQAQVRTRNEQYTDHLSGQKVTALNTTENQTIVVSNTRNAVGTLEDWVAITSTYTTWVNSGAITSCSNWSPATSTVTIGQSFTQTATDCAQSQARTRQDREQETNTGEIRNKGSAVTETQSIAASSTRAATGTKETWVAAAALYGNWANSSALYSCSNWSPAGSAYTYSASFTQTANNCSLNQTRSAQARQQETTTGAYRNVGAATTESRTLTSQTATRPYAVTIGGWQNSGGVAGCSNWSPDPSTVNSGIAFTQTATNCTQAQVRSRVEQYNDHATGILTTAVNTSEWQTVGSYSTRTATGTKTTQQCQTGGWVVTAEVIGPMGPRPVLRVYWAGALMFTNASYNGSDGTMAYGGYTYIRGAQYNAQTWNLCRQ